MELIYYAWYGPSPSPSSLRTSTVFRCSARPNDDLLLGWKTRIALYRISLFTLPFLGTGLCTGAIIMVAL